jgi:glucan biosynthesis protein
LSDSSHVTRPASHTRRRHETTRQLKDLDYDHYRQIRFLPEHALWHGERLTFEVQFFHRGFFYAPRIDIYEVPNGQATKIAYRSADFAFGSNTPPPKRIRGQIDSHLAIARAKIEEAENFEEAITFLNSSAVLRALSAMPRAGRIAGLNSTIVPKPPANL